MIHVDVHWLLSKLDTSHLAGPSRRSVEQVLAACACKDWVLAAASANLGRDIADACKDQRGHAVLLLMNCACCLFETGRYKDAALKGLKRSRLMLGCRHDRGDRVNQSIAAICWYAATESMMSLGDAASLLEEATWRISETGDVERFDDADELWSWCVDQVDRHTPSVFVDAKR